MPQAARRSALALLVSGLFGGLGCEHGADAPSAEELPRVEAGAPQPPEPPEPPPALDCRTSASHEDADRDGFSPDEGDCDDCDGRVNPRALDVPQNDLDEDCSGADALADEPCDADLDPESATAEDAARALDMCRTEAAGSWGLVSAVYRRFNDTRTLEDPLQVWFPERFGTIEPRRGSRLLVISTGTARDVEDRSYTPGCDVFRSRSDAQSLSWTGGTPPENWPKDSSQCDLGASVDALAYNDVTLELELIVPSNAYQLSFDSMFFTYEYPDYVCSRYNDFFLVLAGGHGVRRENVLFDENHDPIGVNTALLSVCRESDRPARPIACEQGPELLEKTGFDIGESTCASGTTEHDDIGGASTGWLHTTVPVRPGKRLTLRFTLWDHGDPLLDSTVIIDHLRFSVEPPDEDEPRTRPITVGP